MSFEAAIGRVDQILQFQQQIFDPGTAVSSTSSSGGAGLSAASTGTDPTSGATTASDFASALASAQAASNTEAATNLLSDGSADNSLGSNSSQLTSSLYAPLAASSAAGVESALAGATTSLGGTSLGSTSLGATGLDGTATGAATSLGGTSLGGTGLDGTATGAANPQLQAMISEANSLVGEPYIWGGGHSNWTPQPGYDCSGFVSAVLHAGGYLSSPQDTATLPSAAGIQPGPGQYVTIYDRDESGQQGHVIIDLDGQFYESGGEAGPWGGGGGVEAIATPSASYLATFNDVLHPAGL